MKSEQEQSQSVSGSPYLTSHESPHGVVQDQSKQGAAKSQFHYNIANQGVDLEDTESNLGSISQMDQSYFNKSIYPTPEPSKLRKIT